jgi:hypothetical protein
MASLLVGGQAFGGTTLTVYVSSNGSPAENLLIHNVLAGRGYTVIDGVAPASLTGATDLGVANVVLLNCGGGASLPSIPVDGQTKLVNFVNSGKGLVTGEWYIWSPGTTLAPILPATQAVFVGTSTVAQTYTRSAADVLMNEGLGAKGDKDVVFNADNHGGTATLLAPKTGATPVRALHRSAPFLATAPWPAPTWTNCSATPSTGRPAALARSRNRRRSL